MNVEKFNWDVYDIECYGLCTIFLRDSRYKRECPKSSDGYSIHLSLECEIRNDDYKDFFIDKNVHEFLKTHMELIFNSGYSKRRQMEWFKKNIENDIATLKPENNYKYDAVGMFLISLFYYKMPIAYCAFAYNSFVPMQLRNPFKFGNK